MKVDNFFTCIANSKWGKKFYDKVLNPKHSKFLDVNLPIIESATISGFYIFSTAVQPKIDKDSKTALQIQNILSFIASVGLSIPMNKGVSKFGEKVIKYLKPELMNDGHKVVDGIKVGLPIAMSLLVSRFLVATALVPLSSIIRDGVKKHNENKNLNVIA
jgi:hypothetical protein